MYNADGTTVMPSYVLILMPVRKDSDFLPDTSRFTFGSGTALIVMPFIVANRAPAAFTFYPG